MHLAAQGTSFHQETSEIVKSTHAIELSPAALYAESLTGMLSSFPQLNLLRFWGSLLVLLGLGHKYLSCLAWGTPLMVATPHWFVGFCCLPGMLSG